MKKIIVGLGNPGSEYVNNRHNTGFLFVDYLARGKSFTVSKKFESEVLEVEDMLLVKPQTYMNNSGRAVRKILDFYKQDFTSLVLIHDDLDIVLGEYKLQLATGPKVHNGVNSVEQQLGEKGFLRLRIGVDGRGEDRGFVSGSDYVLNNFELQEKEVIQKVFEKASVELLVALGL